MSVYFVTDYLNVCLTNICSEIDNFDERLRVARRVVQSLPQANFDLLKRVAEHLDKVADYEEHNHMTLDSLSIVFSPNLLRAPHDDITVILANMGFTHKIVKTLVGHVSFFNTFVRHALTVLK
jgi:GTPase-activating protein BEM2